MSARARRNAFWPVMSEDQLAVAAMAEQRRAERQVKVLGLAALFGIAGEDASTIELDFTRNPQNRRSEDLTKHTALTLRARKRFLSGRGKAVAA